MNVFRIEIIDTNCNVSHKHNTTCTSEKEAIEEAKNIAKQYNEKEHKLYGFRVIAI